MDGPNLLIRLLDGEDGLPPAYPLPRLGNSNGSALVEGRAIGISIARPPIRAERMLTATAEGARHGWRVAIERALGSSATGHMVSVILTTYNRPDALSAVLRALGRQSDLGFEVLVADDGSGPPTAELLRRLRGTLPFELQHVWQEDLGFRAARSRNRAVAQSHGDYLIFLDGDCVPLADFVERHRRIAESGWFVAGNRVMLSAAFTERALRESLAIETWPLSRWLVARARGEIRRMLPLLRIHGSRFKGFVRRRWHGAKTCNLGVWRRDFLAVDGFDENFSGWGHEDADLVARLIATGVYRKSGRFQVPVLHLWHAAQDRANEAENFRRVERVLAEGRTLAERGVSAHLG